MGKREENRKSREEAVLTAARGVFAHKPFDEVTTVELAQASGLSTGTFFRHAGSKAEILIAVYIGVLEQGLKDEEQLPPSADLETRARTLVDPIVTATEENRLNMLAFQREVLFGTAHGPYRERAINLIRDIERRMYVFLKQQGVSRHSAKQVAASIYSLMYMELVRVTVDGSAVKNMRGRLYDQIEFIAGNLHL